MEYILKEYKKRCKEEFAMYDFKAYKSNHYRVVGDVFQSFNLHQSVSGESCTVEFGIIPLSVEYNIGKSSCNPYHLKTFENVYEWFSYDRNSIASMNSCIDKMITYMNKYLMLVFEKAINCESAYSTIIAYDNVFKGNAYERLCMCLKFGDYKSAKKHLQEVIEQHENAFMRNKEALGDNITQEYIQEIEEKTSQNQMLLNLIIDKDYDTIQEWLLSNENRNRQRLNIK